MAKEQYFLPQSNQSLIRDIDPYVANVLHLKTDLNVKTIALYETEDGKRPFKQWLDSLRDKVTIARINARLGRIELGNFGDAKPVGNGVMELRLVFGSGYRIYYGLDGDKLVVLLMGGDKSTQEKDIKTAHNYWSDYLRRTQNE
jgi:putative addiction module killer protein